MLSPSSKITFVFNHGRKSRLNNTSSFPKEHFYCYFNFLEEYKNTKIIEYSESESSYKLISRILRKIFNFPIYIGKLLNSQNKKLIRESEIIIFSNQNTYYSSFFYFLLKKIKHIEIIVLFMGYKNVLEENGDFNFLQKSFFKLMISKISKILFISNYEKELFIKEFPEFKSRTSFVNFGIDYEFWKSKTSLNDRKKILFLGNDKNRDYECVVDIVNQLKHENFLLISNGIKEEDLKFDNYKLINSDWKTNKISDLELRSLMEEVGLSIIPIYESTTQPSGQSVALQSFAMEIPVLITKFKGLWDQKNIKDMENIFIVENNSIENWENKIDEVLKNNELRNKISYNAKELVKNKLNLKNFYSELLGVINS